jgi:hypothetical protein
MGENQEFLEIARFQLRGDQRGDFSNAGIMIEAGQYAVILHAAGADA